MEQKWIDSNWDEIHNLYILMSEAVEQAGLAHRSQVKFVPFTRFLARLLNVHHNRNICAPPPIVDVDALSERSNLSFDLLKAHEVNVTPNQLQNGQSSKDPQGTETGCDFEEHESHRLAREC